MQKNLNCQIAQLESQLFPDDAWTADSIAALLSTPHNDMIILQNHGELRGYCLYQSIFETAEILRIGVHPSRQHQGIGTQILTDLIKKLGQQSVENLLLEVRADNQNAIHFYQKFGFTIIHVRKNYYSLKHGESVNALIMQKTILKTVQKTMQKII